MKFIYFFTFLLIVFAPSAVANCDNVMPNTEKEINYAASSFSEKCIRLKGLDSRKTIIVAEASVISAQDNQNGFQRTYSYEVRTNPGGQLHLQVVDSEMDVYEFSGHTEVVIRLMARNGAPDNDFTFKVINKMTSEGFSIIYIYVEVKHNIPQGPIEGGGPFLFAGSKKIVKTEVGVYDIPSTLLEADSCLSGQFGNRPPHKPPKSKKNGEYFNYNKTIEKNKLFKQKIELSITNPVEVENFMMLRMYVTSQMGGEYDIKSRNSSWRSNNGADNGNFLYGLNMASFGFNEDQTMRFSAAYQAIQNASGTINFASVSQAIDNFMNNSGDNLGDRDMVLRGHRYATQVYPTVENTVNIDNEEMSCVDEQTVSDSDSGSNGGGGIGIAPGGGITIGGGFLQCTGGWYQYTGTTADGTYCEGWSYIP
jgi:hypothetical protein